MIALLREAGGSHPAARSGLAIGLSFELLLWGEQAARNVSSGD